MPLTFILHALYRLKDNTKKTLSYLSHNIYIINSLRAGYLVMLLLSSVLLPHAWNEFKMI